MSAIISVRRRMRPAYRALYLLTAFLVFLGTSADSFVALCKTASCPMQAARREAAKPAPPVKSCCEKSVAKTAEPEKPAKGCCCKVQPSSNQDGTLQQGIHVDTGALVFDLPERIPALPYLIPPRSERIVHASDNSPPVPHLDSGFGRSPPNA